MNKKNKKDSKKLQKDPLQYLRREIDKANLLLSRNKPKEALDHLLKLNNKFPKNPKVLELMAYAYSDLKNTFNFLDTMLQLNDLVKNDEYYLLGLAEAYLANDFRSLALQTYRQLHLQWPYSKKTSSVQEIIQKLEMDISESSSKLTFSLEPGLVFFSKHEQIQILMNQGNFEQSKEIAGEIISQRPNFAPVWNNLAHIAWLEGNLSNAIEILQKVLDFQPENVHALSTLCNYLYMQGKNKESFILAGKSHESRPSGYQFWLEKVKALGFIGDDDGVIALLEQAKKDQSLDFVDGTFWHWCAVAQYRKGNIPVAKTYWQKCAEMAPYFPLATANLKELEKPLHERVCPQVFHFESWLPEKVIREMIAIFEDSSANNEIEDYRIKLQTCYSHHPEFFPFIKSALGEGDLTTREFALQIADFLADPEILIWLKSFALGNVGPYSFRLRAAQILAKHDIFKSGEKINMQFKGETKPMIIFGFQINFGSPEKGPLKQSTRILMEKAIDAFRKKNGVKAENYLRKALQFQPEEPSLLNNLAFSLQLQGKNSEAEALATRIEKDFPDYFFSRLISIRKEVKAGNVDKAQAILDKLMKKESMHISEFSALCACQIDLHILNKNSAGAKSWLQIWKDVYPEDPALEKYGDLSRLHKNFSAVYEEKSKSKN